MKKFNLKFIAILMLFIFLLNLIIPVALATSKETIDVENSNTDEIVKNQDRNEEVEEEKKSEIAEPSETLETNQTAEPSERPEKQEKSEDNSDSTGSKQNSDEKANDTNKENEIMTISAGTQVIADGLYKIKACVGTNMYLDIDGGKTNNGANLQIWKKDNVPQQKFQVTYLNNGYYKITAYHSGKVLDVNNAGKTNGTNVKQYANNGSDAQQWIIKQVSSGYNIISKCNNLNLDIFGGYGANGTNVQMYKSNGTNAQKFIFEEVKEEKPQHTLDNGTYKISANIGTNMCLDIDGGKTNNGANLQIWKTDNVGQQKFNIKDIGQGYYTITASHSGKVLDVNNAGKKNGTNVWQYAGNNTDAQQWIIKSLGNNKYNIISKCSGLYLDVYGGYSSNGTNVQTYEGNGTNSQIFTITKVTEPKAGKTIENGVYKIKTNVGTNMYLDIDGGKTSNSANLQIWQKSNVKQQLFQITYLNNGYYKISPIHASNKVLDVAGATTKNGTNVAQYESNGTNAQQWIIQEAGNDFYNIISKCSKTCLNVNGSKNGSNVQIYEGNGSNAQKFIFEKKDIEREVYDGTYRISSAICYENSHYKNYALDISGGSKSANANLQIWGNTNVLQQKFIITRVKDGYYTIEPSHVSGMALQVSGKNVVQAKKNTNIDSQLWMIEKSGNKYWTIKSKSTGLYLDIYDGKLADGQNVQVHEGNGTNAQKWKIEEVYFGIDVSYAQGNIDANALINSRRADFAIMRIGFSEDNSSGGRKITETGGERVNYAKLKGKIPLGAYIYTYADTLEDAKNDARAVVNLVKTSGWNYELPIFFDIEDAKQANLSTSLRTSMCKAFCEILYQNGLKPGIYSNVNKLNSWINIDQIPSYTSIWVAGYGYNDGYVPGDKYKFTKNHNVWQYSSTGTIDGISGNVDVNITFKKTW